MPLVEGQPFDNNLFKLFAALVRDIKMGVDVVSACASPCMLQQQYSAPHQSRHTTSRHFYASAGR